MTHSMLKKTAALLAGTAMLVGVTACGRTNTDSTASADDVTTIDSSPATGELTIWAMGNEGDLLGDFVKDFEEENPDVTVTVTAIPWSSAHDKLQTAIAAGNGPDIAQMGTTWMADFSDSFSQVPDNFDLSDFSEGPLEAGQVDGTQLGIPWYVDTRVLYYRTDIAEQAGWTEAPETWDELKQMAQDLQKVDGVEWGMYQQPSGTDSFIGVLPYVFSAGAELTDDGQTQWTLNTDAMKEALDFTSSLYEDGIADPNADVSAGANITNFVSGEAPMMIEGPTAVSQINELGGEGFEDKYTTVTLPSMDGSPDAVSFVGGCDLVVFKDSDNKQAAWKFIQWASQPEVQAAWYELSSDLPASQTAWSDEALADNDKLVAFGDQLESTMAPPALATWAQVGSAGDRIVEQINKGQVTVEEGLESLQSEADSIGMGN
ncbi:ABC transporter substrate-binding protein [Bifidobacterium lemurum]|uniref:ABC transporter substrate-binding protein n=1 Tax=Bifidobacterium lemurum TaxID=1603886 RepID=A0A261FQ47_9BIFI|nr:extracellular solute-binding protein [Bifidobacterium lemurum]OZG61311.1 ABC transporter substrate-binding protein [Bifidobacterium lemurum]QOL34699.1 extracellular solute-binding protein [Bifidobacterium lemurum]